MFRNVREDVIRDSNGTQVPWVASSLIGTFHVRPDQDLTDRLLPDISDRHTELAGVYERSFRSNSANTPQMETLTPDLSSRLDQARDLVRGGKLEEAASILQDVLRLNPACAAALDLLGLIFHRESRDEMALDTFGRALLENPQDSAAAAYKCALEQLIGRSSARNDCSDLALNHPSAETYLVLALAQHSNGDETAAYNSATTSLSLADTQSATTSSEARQERKPAESSSQP
jgi:tetratricopeptide (TPR) repeat protein